MYRDIRDPQEIGAALDAQRAHSPSESICDIADKVMADDTIRYYGESNAAYTERVHTSSNGNGQPQMFRAA